MDHSIVRIDAGEVNARILARQSKADFRRVEEASLKLQTHLTSAEAKRLFVRLFNSVQLNMHFVSVVGRFRLDLAAVEAAEAKFDAEVVRAKAGLTQAIDEAEALFQANGISGSASYDTQPMVIEVCVISSSGRRFLELLHQLDQLMPLLKTLEIHEVITPKAMDDERQKAKRLIRGISISTRHRASEMRRRIDALVGAPFAAEPVRVTLDATQRLPSPSDEDRRDLAERPLLASTFEPALEPALDPAPASAAALALTHAKTLRDGDARSADPSEEGAADGSDDPAGSVRESVEERTGECAGESTTARHEGPLAGPDVLANAGPDGAAIRSSSPMERPGGEAAATAAPDVLFPDDPGTSTDLGTPPRRRADRGSGSGLGDALDGHASTDAMRSPAPDDVQARPTEPLGMRDAPDEK